MQQTKPSVGAPPGSFADLAATIAQEHPRMSPRLRQIAEFALANPNDMALETVATVAERAGVQPSALIRFAKLLGYDGFTEMQRVFRMRLTEAMPSYSERLRSLTEDEAWLDEPEGVLEHFTQAGIAALDQLRQEIQPQDLAAAVDLLAGARRVFLAGFRRSFPVAAYFAYAFAHLGWPTILIDNVGGLARQQMHGLDRQDLLLAISFKPYAPEVVDLVRTASGLGAPVLVITDSPLSPLAPLASLVLPVQDAQVKGFRALSATMCLAVSLVIALGRRLEGGGPRSPQSF